RAKLHDGRTGESGSSSHYIDAHRITADRERARWQSVSREAHIDRVVRREPPILVEHQGGEGKDPRLPNVHDPRDRALQAWHAHVQRAYQLRRWQMVVQARPVPANGTHGMPGSGPSGNAMMVHPSRPNRSVPYPCRMRVDAHRPRPSHPKAKWCSSSSEGQRSVSQMATSHSANVPVKLSVCAVLIPLGVS